jgi:hypothetical protein
MTRYAKSPDKRVSKAISQHLDMLSNHPDCDSDIIKKAGKRLAIQWQEQLQESKSNKDYSDPVYKEIKNRKLH